MLIRNRTIYRVCVFLPDSELAALTHPDKDWADIALSAISNAGWLGALRSDRRAEDKNSNDGIEITFEVETAEERDRLLAWLKTNPFTAQGRRRDQD